MTEQIWLLKFTVYLSFYPKLFTSCYSLIIKNRTFTSAPSWIALGTKSRLDVLWVVLRYSVLIEDYKKALPTIFAILTIVITRSEIKRGRGKENYQRRRSSGCNFSMSLNVFYDFMTSLQIVFICDQETILKKKLFLFVIRHT